MVIPLDLPSSHQEPKGPMTRARARALETKVTSFLSDITYDPLETWLLPQSRMLCMIRYQEDPPEDAREDGKVPKFTEEENQQKESRTAPRSRTSSPWRCRLQQRTSGQVYRARTSGVQPGHPAKARTSGQKPRHPAPRYRTSRSFALQPGHPASPGVPDIRPVARTSGHPCLRTVRAEARVPLRLPRLYTLSPPSF